MKHIHTHTHANNRCDITIAMGLTKNNPKQITIENRNAPIHSSKMTKKIITVKAHLTEERKSERERKVKIYMKTINLLNVCVKLRCGETETRARVPH